MKAIVCNMCELGWTGKNLHFEGIFLEHTCLHDIYVYSFLNRDLFSLNI